MTGDLGESLASVFLSRKTSQGNLFRTTMIGGKWPTIDIYAEIISNTASRMFCFFQVKTTDQGYTKKKKNLKVGIDLDDLIKLSQYHAPSYLIGIDHNPTEPFKSKPYIAAIRGNYSKRISSLPTAFELTEANLILLRDEVVGFWNSANANTIKTTYLSNFII